MSYSKKRLTAIAVCLVAVWLVLLTGPMYEDVAESTDSAFRDVIADDGTPEDSCPNTYGPCAFPAENYNGGIILGASFLEGTQIALFNENGVSGSQLKNPFDDGETPSSFLPPDAADKGSNVKSVRLGLDVATVDDFFVYKTWKTGAPIPNHDDVYAYIQTDNATLDGPTGSGNDCTAQDSPDGYDPADCDLNADVVEISAGRLCVGGSGSLSGIAARDDKVFFGGARPPDKQRAKSIPASEFSEQPADNCNDAIDNGQKSFSKGCATDPSIPCEGIGYWTEDPENDHCGAVGDGGEEQYNDLGPIVALDFLDLSADLQGFCLYAADPEATYIGQDFSIDRLQIDDLFIRSHRIVAERENGVNKELRLNNFYAEIRWGKGHDRANIAESGMGYKWPDIEYENQFVGSRSAGLANSFPCEGNRLSDNQGATWGDNQCEIDGNNAGTLQRGSYDDIYR